MKYFLTFLCLIILAFTSQAKALQKTTQTFSQPSDERAAQEKLPVSKDNMWAILGKTVVSLDEKQYTFSAKYPKEVKDLEGKTVTIKGFVLPLDATEKFKHFILSKRTPTCPYCPPGEPNEIIEVFSAQPIKWNENMVTVTGKFSLINNQNFGMFFKIDNASVK